MLAVTIDDIRAAAVRIAPWAHRTPVLTSQTLNRLAGRRVYLKCENFQVGGAFKFRGAANFVFSLSPAELERGVLAFSSGNHAQAVALAAARAGTRATVVMPLDAPKAKIAATRAAGAEIVPYDRFTEDREAICAGLAEKSGAAMIPPFDHARVIAGQGTVALELLADVPAVDTLLVPTGGAGLLGGSAVAAHAVRPEIRVYGIEPEIANDVWQSKHKGERVTIAPPATIADGLRTPAPGRLTFPIVREQVEDLLLVTEEEIRAAVRFLLERMKIVAEPSGAVGVAAALHGKLPAGAGDVGIVISGGNVDLDQLAAICAG